MSSSLVAATAGLPRPGELLQGKYRIERYLAHGGMGVVAAARHVELDEPVALKFLRADLLALPGSAELCARFLREAKATIKIRSAHVPRILDVSTTPSGVPFMVMELLTGEDLDDYLAQNGQLEVSFAVEVMLQALEGLAAAHAFGMVHRDFKPANVFLGRSVDGSLAVKVLDFGIAKLQDTGLVPTADASMTSTNHVMGSPRYMAPEQMRSSRDIDARADIWAVGTTLYEMLVREPPFEGESIPQICMSILQDAPKPISAKRSDVPPGLVTAIERCLGKTPDTRLQNAAEVAEAIAPYGPQPWSLESAARTRRLVNLGPPRGSRPSFDGSVRPIMPSKPDAEPELPIVPIVPIVRTPPEAFPVPPPVLAAASLGETSGSWSRAGVGLPAKRPLGLVVGTVAAAAIALAGGAFLLLRGDDHEGRRSVDVAATPPPIPSALDVPPVPSLAEDPPMIRIEAQDEAVPAPAPELESPPPSKPTTKTATRPPPNHATTAAATATAASTSKTAPSASAKSGGLWDDRK